MATTASFASTPKIFHGQVTAANTNRDGTGTIVDIVTAAPAAGYRIDNISITATGTTSANVIRLYLYNGTNSRLWKEIVFAAVTPSTSVPVAAYYASNLGILLEQNWKLQASTNNAETWNIFAWGGEF